MKILITGCAGYIGSMLSTRLVTKHPNSQIVGVDNLMFGQQSLGHLAKYDNFEFIKMDVGDFNSVFNLLKTKGSFDFIFPLAALVGTGLCNTNKALAKEINYLHIHNLLTRQPNAHIIYPNTNSGYGIGGENFCTEESPLNPISVYGKTKCEAEDCLLESGNHTIFRLATVFGASYRFRQDLLVNDFVARAYKDSFIVLFEANFRRNYISVDDVVNAFEYAMDKNRLAPGVYNLGLSEANLTKMELCLKIKRQVPEFVIKTDEFAKDPDKRDYIISNDKVEKAGFIPQINLETGIKELIHFYKMLPRKEFTNV